LIINRGFSLVEAILSVAVLSLLVTAAIGAIVYGKESSSLSGARARAVFLAEEGLEGTRNIRDASFANLVDGTYGLAATSGQWTLSGLSDEQGVFTRQITISTIDVNTRQVTSQVSWQQNPQRVGSVTLDSYLTNWLAVGNILPGAAVAYYDAGGGNLKYAVCSSNCTQAASWTFLTIDTAGDVGRYASLVFDNGKPRISYYDNSNKDLKYASCDSNCTQASSWTIVAVDSAGDVGKFGFLALDSGKPRISYYDDAPNKNLKYASCDTDCTQVSDWVTVTVDSGGDVGQYSSLGLDSGKPRISYYDDAPNKNLKYASCDTDCIQAASWTTTAIDSAGDVGQYSSLVLDGSKPHISYYDSGNRDLKYASCESSCGSPSSWTLATPDSSGNIGEYSSIALDSGKPRISYFDNSNSDLKHASCDTGCDTGGNWTKVSIDTAGNVGQYTSINK